MQSSSAGREHDGTETGGLDGLTLKRVSQALLHLSRGGREWPQARCASRTIDLMRDLLPLQAITWGTCHSVGLKGSTKVTPPETDQSINQHYLGSFRAIDPALAMACASPGSMIELRNAIFDQPLNDSHFHRAFMHRWQLDNALCITTEDRNPVGAGFISLWREASQGPFTENERQLAQFMAPHLLDTFAQCLLNHWRGAAVRSHDVSSRLAIFDRSGTLLAIEASCQSIFNREWPNWTLSQLPPELLTLLQAPEADPFVGSFIAVSASADQETVALHVRGRINTDRLTVRERQVAELYAHGQTSVQTAARLGLSASTVENHMFRIYKKLGIANRTQLLEHLAQIGSPSH